jgi:hypothetical protein
MLLDILRALKGADSLSRRSMSRTEEDIDGGRTWVPAFIANLTREKP